MPEAKDIFMLTALRSRQHYEHFSLTHLIYFDKEDFICRTAETVEEATKLIEADFEMLQIV